MSDNLQQQKSGSLFFYADEEAKLYDELAPLTDPAYELLHNSLVSQFSTWLTLNMGQHLPCSELLVLDIGCGTGAEGMNLLRENDLVQLVGLDISKRMLDQFRLKLNKVFHDESAAGRCALVQVDIRDPNWYDSVLSSCGSQGRSNSFTAIISVYTLHHFSPVFKRNLYTAFHKYLRPGGAFINADLFSFCTPWLARMAQLSVENWITKQFAEASKNSNKYSIKEPSEWKILTEHWLQHVQEQNYPIPALAASAETLTHGDQNIDQILLTEAGFNAVECTFRYGQSAIIWAFKENQPHESQ